MRRGSPLFMGRSPLKPSQAALLQVNRRSDRESACLVDVCPEAVESGHSRRSTPFIALSCDCIPSCGDEIHDLPEESLAFCSEIR